MKLMAICALTISRGRAPVQLDGQFRELDLDFDANTGVFWCRFQFSNRPSFTPEVWANCAGCGSCWRPGLGAAESRTGAAGTQTPQVKYMVLASRMQGIFNLGGDLHLFAELIRRRDRAALTAYARACVAEVHANSMALDLPIITDVAGAGRRPGRRVRSGAVEQRHHRRAERQVRPAGDHVQPFPRHGRLQLHRPPDQCRDRRTHDHERPHPYRRRTV